MCRGGRRKEREENGENGEALGDVDVQGRREGERRSPSLCSSCALVSRTSLISTSGRIISGGRLLPAPYIRAARNGAREGRFLGKTRRAATLFRRFQNRVSELHSFTRNARVAWGIGRACGSDDRGHGVSHGAGVDRRAPRRRETPRSVRQGTHALPPLDLAHLSSAPARDARSPDARVSPPRRPPRTRQFFASIGANDLDAFLACTASSTRAPRGPGSFEQIDWNEGRERFRKYKARYAFLRDREIAGDPDACDATYLPHFGAVPGYREGAAFTDERGVKQHVIVRLRREKIEWGKPKEWRVAGIAWAPAKEEK